MAKFNNQGAINVEKLGDDPYKEFFLAQYSELVKINKYQKKITKFEKEIARFNGVNSFDQKPDYLEFYDFINRHYFSINNKTIEPRYKQISSNIFNGKFDFIYFIMIYIKRKEESEQIFLSFDKDKGRFQNNKNLTRKVITITNEWKLLFGLLEKCDNLVLAIINSFDLQNTKHLDDNLKEIDNVTLKHRFLIAISRREKNVAFKLLGRLRELDDGEDNYLEALAHFNNEEYASAIRYSVKVKHNEIDYPAASAMVLECYAMMGDIENFTISVNTIKQKISGIYLVYLLQILICNADIFKFEDTYILSDFENDLIRKIELNDDTDLTGLVYRNIVKIVLEYISFVTDLLIYEPFLDEEVDISSKTQLRLRQLGYAIEIYPDSISRFGNIEYIREIGLEECKKEISKWVLNILINVNPDTSFKNIYIAMMAQYELDQIHSFINNVDSNLDTLIKYGNQGEKQAYELINIAYLESNLLGMNKTYLFNAIIEAKLELESSFADKIKTKKVFDFLSDNGKIAYEAAEWQYNLAMEQDYGWKDAGMLSLGYFRILELEFNQKLVLPLLSQISLTVLDAKFRLHTEELSEKREKDNYQFKWGKLIKAFKNIIDPKKDADGLMLGELNFLLTNIGDRYDNEDEVASYINNSIKNILNEQGHIDLLNGVIGKILSSENRSKFRNPPAHTKYLHIDTAVTCREFVNKNILYFADILNQSN